MQILQKYSCSGVYFLFAKHTLESFADADYSVFSRNCASTCFHIGNLLPPIYRLFLVSSDSFFYRINSLAGEVVCVYKMGERYAWRYMIDSVHLQIMEIAVPFLAP